MTAGDGESGTELESAANGDRLEAFATEMLGIFNDHELKRITDVPIDALSIAEAYRVQDLVVARRVAAGERVAGYKVGCTSSAIRAQFGLTNPICGHLLEPHVLKGDVSVDVDTFVDCAVEPEFVLRIATDLEGHDLEDEVLRSAIDSVSIGVEIHNYRFFHGAPTWQELIVSNGIHAALVIGESSAALGDADLDVEGLGVFVNGTLVESGIGAEIMGGPMRSLRWLVGHLTDRGRVLRAGELVIPGSPVGLVRVVAGDEVVARSTRFGAACVQFD